MFERIVINAYGRKVKDVGHGLEVLDLRVNVLKHLLVRLAALEELQLLDVIADDEELSRQSLVLDLHLLLEQVEREKKKCFI